jgi:hypothetical protein
MNNNLIKNLPNAAKLVDSLRHLDYENTTALADIIDNSIDANATKVWVDIVPKKDKEQGESEVGKIIISDNGYGMPHEVLDEALKLGSNIERNATCDLGLYGMGLVTASISLGTRLEVITKTQKGECLRSVQDLNLVYEHNDFVKLLDKADKTSRDFFYKQMVERQQKYLTKEEKKNPKRALRDSGTVVIVDMIDNCAWKRAKALAENLNSHFGQIYRKFIQANKISIYVEGKAVDAKDPINDYEPNILYNDTVKLEDGDIDITIAALKDYGRSINREKGINIPNQGFYVVRNNREILAGQSFGLFTKHNDYNTLRIEFSYPGTLDRILSSNFSKNKITLNQSIKNKVEKVCTPFINQVRKRALERRESRKEKKEDFSDVEKFITQKSHLLKIPPAEIEERGPKTQKSTEKIKKNIEKHGPRLNIKKRKRINLEDLKVKFNYRRFGEKGPLYEADREREKTVIYWNEDHPFYREFIEKNHEKPDIFNPICFLIYCLASAELGSKPESDSYEIVESIRYDVGRNLAVLLR